MASYNHPTRTRSTMYDNDNDYSHHSTAYHGAQGHINEHHHYQPADLHDEVCDDIQMPASAMVTAARPALGSRWLSTLSNAQSGSALKRSGSVLHSRAKSLAAFVPKLNTTSNTTTPDKAPQQPQQANRIFGNLFNGESAPVHIGVASASPAAEESEFVMEYKPTFTERPSPPRRRSVAPQTSTSTPSTTSTGARASGWFTRKASSPAVSQPPPPSPPTQDPLLSLNIPTALFPHGPADPLSPHAFNDLLLNATHLLQRLQTAYKEKVDYISSIRPEIDAQKEEVEEAETRSRHLKMQLEDMGRKSEEQNRAMRELARQLAEEKEAKEEMARSLVRVGEGEGEGCGDEDTPRRRKRGSAGSASDSGFESDAEYAESVMSGTLSPTPPPAVTLTHAADWQTPLSKSRYRPTLSRQSTAASQLSGSYAYGLGSGSGKEGWASVDQLRGENRELRRRVYDMQAVLQGCIELVDGVKG